MPDGMDEPRDESGYLFTPSRGAETQQAGDDDAGASGNVSAFGMGDLLRMVLVLLMVIGAVYGVVAFLRKRIPTGARDETDSPIRVLAARNIGANRDIYAVMIGRQVLVIGGGDASLQLITTVEDQETIDELVLAASSAAEQPKPRTFGSMLGKWLNNATVPGSGSNATEASQIRSFLHLQQERVRKMR